MEEILEPEWKNISKNHVIVSISIMRLTRFVFLVITCPMY